jgi:hypothetical protein
MQPIKQASLDPKFNDIRHLLAEQSTDGVIGCFGLSILYRRTTRAFQTSLFWQRILLRFELNWFESCTSTTKQHVSPGKTRVRGRLWRLTGRLTRGKVAHKTTQHLQAWTCMDRQESQRNFAEMRKTMRKPGFLSGEDWTRTFRCFPGDLVVRI